MAVSENDLLVGPITPASGVDVISLDFFFERKEWLEVYKSGSDAALVLDADYTVSGEGTDTGSITLTTPANGESAYSVFLAVPLERSSDMQLRGEFKSGPFNLEMDRIWQSLQLQWTHIQRTVRLSSTTSIGTVISSISAGQYLRMKGDGTGFEGVEAQVAVTDVDAWFQKRDVTSATQAAFLLDGSIVSLNGILYRTNKAATGSASATNDLGVDGLEAVGSGVFHVESYGVNGGISDASDQIENLISSVPDGSEIHFDGTKEYVANINVEKGVRLKFNGAKIAPAALDEDCIRIAPNPSTVTNHNVLETTLPYGSTQFSITDADTKFSVGDIGTLHDGALRPSDEQPVNYLTVKIKDIVGDVITVDGFTRSHMGATGGAITFRHSTAQIKDAGIFNVRVNMPEGSSQNAILISDVERPTYDGIETTGTIGKGLTIRYFYDLKGGTYFGSKPRATGSGEGYGLQLLYGCEGHTGPCRGVGMRHAFDADSIYGMSIGLVTDPNAISSPLTFAHNGFAGHLRIAGFMGVANAGSYPIVGSEQGYGTGTNRALKGNHLFRNIKIERNDVTTRGLDPNSFIVLTYFQNGAVDCDPGIVAFRMEDQTAITATAASVAVRVNGPIIGRFPVNVSGDRIGYALSRFDDDGYAGTQGVIQLQSVQLDQCRQIAFVRGGGTFIAGPAVVGEMKASPVYRCDQIGSNTLDRVEIEVPEYDNTLRQILSTNAITAGRLGLSQKSSGAAITSPNGKTVTATDIQNRNGYMRIVGDVGSGTDTLSSFAGPSLNGEECIVLGYHGASRKNVTIPTDAGVATDIVFDANNPVRKLIGFNGQWVAV